MPKAHAEIAGGGSKLRPGMKECECAFSKTRMVQGPLDYCITNQVQLGMGNTTKLYRKAKTGTAQDQLTDVFKSVSQRVSSRYASIMPVWAHFYLLGEVLFVLHY